MRKPALPPDISSILRSIYDNHEAINQIFEIGPVDDKGRYLHWDKIRHMPAPQGLTSEQWWCGIQLARKNLQQQTSLLDIHGQHFKYSTPDQVHRELHWLDRYAAGNIQTDEAITNPQTRDTYLIRSLIEEAINSSQLEGASTTRDVAKEMIRQDRAPKDKNERMIMNNYHAMQFIREIQNEQLTPSIVFELHRIVTQGTLDDASKAGRFRSSDEEIYVMDNFTQEMLHKPPEAKELSERLDRLCEFANGKDDLTEGSHFIHPVIRAITLHFMLAYDHPFCDGNGRAARALFYWAMAKHRYWLVEFISISGVIKQAPVQYGKAFLNTETDNNDLTYFLLHQLDVMRKAIEALHEFLDKRTKGINEAEQLLARNNRLRGKLNFRQLALLKHALKHPRFTYVVDEHQRSHGISYDVARKDLLKMADDLKLLIKTKQGKRYLFVVPPDLGERLEKSEK